MRVYQWRESIEMPFGHAVPFPLECRCGRISSSLPQWLSQAAEAAHERRMEGLGKFLEERQAEHGAFSEEEMARARRDLGYEDPE